MLSMQDFMFLEEIIMSNGLPMIYDYMMVLAAVVAQELTISVAIDFSYDLPIQIDVESQLYNTTTANSYILIPIFVSFKKNKLLYCSFCIKYNLWDPLLAYISTRKSVNFNLLASW